MRILHVTPFYEPFWAYGGMARCSAALCRALVRRGHEVTVATALLEPAPRAETLGGVAVRRFPGPAALNRWLVPWAWGLARFVRAELPSCDVVHVHGHRNGLAVAATRVLRSAGRPWVLLTNGTFPHHGQRRVLKALFDRAMGSAVVRRAAAIVAVSECEARDLPRPSRVIPNGVDPCGVATPATTTTARPRIVFVGTDRPQKRGDLLPALMAELGDVELHMVGRYHEPFVRRFAAVGERVRWSGLLAGDALASAYAEADLLVHPAVGEGFGLVPFEAALAGTAAVVAGGHGCGEWYGRAGGCVVMPDDVPQLAEAVRARLRDPALAQAEVRAVGAFARERLTWDRTAAEIESVYREVMGEGR